mmetsp:Transcript_39184/g.34871  ORF Transcript_39184/g.34871 Transcript_39184/m.34871 type:complete len:257 (-) Transcript_39184:1293-2063(-)
MGIITAILSALIDYLIVFTLNLRNSFVKETDFLDSEALRFVLYYITGFIMITISTSMGGFVTPMADGSGIPELKSILSGANTYRYLDMKVFLPKLVGVMTAYGAGLPVGKAGPLIHLATMIAHSLMKKGPFKHMDHNYSMKRSVLTATIACGMGSGLGAPIGGVIFSMELVYGYFNVSNIFKSLYTVGWSFVFLSFMKQQISMDPLVKTEFEHYEFGSDIFSFVILGALAGLIIGIMLKLTIKLIYLRRTLPWKIL